MTSRRSSIGSPRPGCATNWMRSTAPRTRRCRRERQRPAKSRRRDSEEEGRSQASARPVQPASEDAPFSDSLIRWAKLPPKLDASDISGYLYLAASFAGIELVSSALPERLRDIASALTSSVQVDRNAVTDDALRAVKPADARLLVAYLGSLTRDQPTIQKFSVPGILRLAKTHPGLEDAAVSALKLLPPSEVKVATVMLLKPGGADPYGDVLVTWDVDGASNRSSGQSRASANHGATPMGTSGAFGGSGGKDANDLRDSIADWLTDTPPAAAASRRRRGGARPAKR